MDPEKNNLDTGGLSPEQLADAIAQYKANHPEGGGAADGGDPINGAGTPPAETKPTAAEQIQAVKDHRDNRDPAADPAQTIAQQDSDIDTLLGIIDALQAANDMGGNNDGGGAPPATATNADGVDIDALVRERLAVARVGDKLGIAGIEAMPIRDAKCAVIKKVNPKLNLDGRTDAYIAAAYDLAAEQAATGSGNPAGSVVAQLGGIEKKNNDGAGGNENTTNAAAARNRMIAMRKEDK